MRYGYAKERLEACVECGCECAGCKYEFDCSIIEINEAAIEALSKQIHKRPIKKKFSKYESYYVCPACGGQVEVEDNEGYLTEFYPSCECGQRINWIGIIDESAMKWKWMNNDKNKK